MWALSELRLRAVLLTALMVLAWVSLWAWGQTPYGLHWHHAAMAPMLLAGIGPPLLFAMGWTLMTVAMMLPTSIPLLNLFYAVVRQREQRFG